jgi:hypothetical protein
MARLDGNFNLGNFFAIAMYDINHESFKNILFIILSTLFLVLVCYKKGEKTRWQWGKRRE